MIDPQILIDRLKNDQVITEMVRFFGSDSFM